MLKYILYGRVSVHIDLIVLIGKTIRKPRKDPKNLSKSYLRKKSKKVLNEIKEATSTNDFLRITTVKNVVRQNDDVKVHEEKMDPLDKDEVIDLLKNLGCSDRNSFGKGNKLF